MFRHIPAEAIPAQWDALSRLLEPAVRQDPKSTLQSVFDGLLSRRFICFEVRRKSARGALIAEIFEEDGKLCCWACFIAGKVDGGPRQFLRTMREIMAGLEFHVKQAGCAEMRIGGRDWSRVFPDFSVADPATNELRKVL